MADDNTPSLRLRQRQVPLQRTALLDAAGRLEAVRVIDAGIHQVVQRTMVQHAGDLKVVLVAVLQHAALIISTFPEEQRADLLGLAERHLEEAVSAHVKHAAVEPAGGE